MCSVIFLCAADPSLGRFDLSSLSDQARMELMLADTSYVITASLLMANGDFKDVCSWKYITCDDEGHVVDFRCNCTFDENIGTLRLDCMPEKLKTCRVESLLCSGTLDTSALPVSLESLILSKTGFSGSVAFEDLPQEILALNLMESDFEGSISLHRLPQKLKYLSLARNNFSGSVRFDNLPRSLTYADLSENKLTGELNFASCALPPKLRILLVSNNAFSGSFHLTTMADIKNLDASSNNLCGTAVVPSYTHTETVFLLKNAVEAVHTLEGETHPREARMLSGSERGLQVASLRREMEYLEAFSLL